MRDIINIQKPFTVKNKKYNFNLDAKFGDKIKIYSTGAIFFRSNIEAKTLSPLWQFDKLFLDEIIEQAKIAGNEITQENKEIGIWFVTETVHPLTVVLRTIPMIDYFEAVGEKNANEKCIPIIKQWGKIENITYKVCRWDSE